MRRASEAREQAARASGVIEACAMFAVERTA
jgi:hypothetical protein